VLCDAFADFTVFDFIDDEGREEETYDIATALYFLLSVRPNFKSQFAGAREVIPRYPRYTGERYKQHFIAKEPKNSCFSRII
jgi:hypothetical protein